MKETEVDVDSIWTRKHKKRNKQNTAEHSVQRATDFVIFPTTPHLTTISCTTGTGRKFVKRGGGTL